MYDSLIMKPIKLHWSRLPGKFLNLKRPAKSPFDGSVREWYETLIEVIRNAATLAGLDKKHEISLSVSPNAHAILQCSVSYKALPASLSYMDTTYLITEDKKLANGCDIMIENDKARIMIEDFNF